MNWSGRDERRLSELQAQHLVGAAQQAVHRGEEEAERSAILRTEVAADLRREEIVQQLRAEMEQELQSFELRRVQDLYDCDELHHHLRVREEFWVNEPNECICLRMNANR